jgi:hypothetical protein
MQIFGSARRLLITFAALGCVLVVAPSAMASAARGTRHAPRHKLGRGTSTNWSGYAVDGTGATHVIGTWTQPSATCAPGETSWSSPWVGIDGDNSNTVEQTGTDSDCNNGTPTYYAWYEMYPKSLVQLSMPVHPNDSMTGEVTYTTSGYILKLTDNTTNTTFQTTQSSKKAQRSSVEWIMEGPSTGTLSNFGTVPFSGAAATINGQDGSLGSFSGAQPITMVNRQGTVRATPSSISGASAFSVAWQHG